MRIISGTRQVVKIFLGLVVFFIEIRLDFPHPLDPNTICKKTTTSVLLQLIVSDWIEFILYRRVVLERESRNRNKYLPYSNTVVHSVTYIDNQISNIPLTQTKIFDSIDRYHHNPQPTLYISLKLSNILHHVNNIFCNGTY